MSTHKAMQAIRAKLATDYADKSMDEVMELAVGAGKLDAVAGPGTHERTVAIAVRSYLSDRVAVAQGDAPTSVLLAELAACVEGDRYKSDEHAAVYRGCERVLEERYPVARDAIDAAADEPGGWEARIAEHGSFGAWIASVFTAAARDAGEAPVPDPAPWKHVDGQRVADIHAPDAPRGGYTYLPREGYSDHGDAYKQAR